MFTPSSKHFIAINACNVSPAANSFFNIARSSILSFDVNCDTFIFILLPSKSVTISICLKSSSSTSVVSLSGSSTFVAPQYTSMCLSSLYGVITSSSASILFIAPATSLALLNAIFLPFSLNLNFPFLPFIKHFAI